MGKVTYEALKKEIKERKAGTIYLLQGEEGYYIDELVKAFEDSLDEDEREYGLSVLYAPQVEIGDIISACRQVPMWCDRQMVIVKELQSARSGYIDKMAGYAANPCATTTLVLCSRGAALKGKEFVKAGGNNIVVFDSPKVTEWQMPKLVEGYIKSKGLTVEPKALTMLGEYIGTDLSRLYNQIDKLAEILGPRARVTPEVIERNIGFSKDYNSFELVDALASREEKKAFRIVGYFEANPKSAPIVMITAAIFNYYADLLVLLYTSDKSDRGMMGALNLRSEFALRRYKKGLAQYDAFQLLDIISSVRRFDAMSKGGGSRTDPYKLLHELVYRILTTTGR